jgi:hypothetical protein
MIESRFSDRSTPLPPFCAKLGAIGKMGVISGIPDSTVLLSFSLRRHV